MKLALAGILAWHDIKLRIKSLAAGSISPINIQSNAELAAADVRVHEWTLPWSLVLFFLLLGEFLHFECVLNIAEVAF